jgi:hypothetical protein
MHGPLGELERQGLIKTRNFSNILEDFADWTYFTKSDIVFIQRPSRAIDFKFMEVAKKYGLKIWADFDDDLLNLPDDNAVFNRFTSSEARKTIEYVYRNADIVTVATHYLKTTMEQALGLREILVIPNAMPPWFLKYKKPFAKSRKICWRGSETHIPELLYHRDDLISLMTENSEWEWLYLGINPYFIQRYVKNARLKFCKALNTIDFIDALSSNNAQIHFVPLLDTKFHRAKSNIAWMEATLAGSVVLGPNFEEWDRPGLINYKCMDNRDFKNRMQYMLNDDEYNMRHNMRQCHNNSWEYIKDNLMLEKVNKLRINLINNI